MKRNRSDDVELGKRRLAVVLEGTAQAEPAAHAPVIVGTGRA